jgi:hypothetical protein
MASKMQRCRIFAYKSRKIMPKALSADAELTAQCTATRMFAIYQSTALFWALAEKKLIDPQHVFATNEALALGFEQMAANISTDDAQRRINQLTAEMLREFEGVIKNVVDNAVEDRAGVSVESIRSDRVTAPERGTSRLLKKSEVHGTSQNKLESNWAQFGIKTRPVFLFQQPARASPQSSGLGSTARAPSRERLRFLTR